MMKMPHHKLLLSLVLFAGLAACAKPEPPAPAFKTTASIQDLMVAIVDPAADTLWEAVGTVMTKDGLEERQPRSDEDWQAVRRQAITLVESANLLLIPGRAVAATGRKVEDAHVPGVLSAEEARQAILRDPAAFSAQALRFHAAAELALKAIDGKNVAGLLAAGGVIQEACESCHRQFWYPNAKQPPG